MCAVLTTIWTGGCGTSCIRESFTRQICLVLFGGRHHDGRLHAVAAAQDLECVHCSTLRPAIQESQDGSASPRRKTPHPETDSDAPSALRYNRNGSSGSIRISVTGDQRMSRVPVPFSPGLDLSHSGAASRFRCTPEARILTREPGVLNSFARAKGFVRGLNRYPNCRCGRSGLPDQRTERIPSCGGGGQGRLPHGTGITTWT